MTTLPDSNHVNLMTEDQLVDWAAEFMERIDSATLAFALDILGFKIAPNVPDQSGWMVHFWPYARPMPDWIENLGDTDWCERNNLKKRETALIVPFERQEQK
jgi:hypothetical protein